MTEHGPRQPPPEWMTSIDRAEADLIAGRVTSGVEVRQRLRDSIEQMQSAAVEEASQDH